MLLVQGSRAARYEISLLLCPRGARRLWWRAGLLLCNHSANSVSSAIIAFWSTCVSFGMKRLGCFHFRTILWDLSRPFAGVAHPITEKHGYCQLKATSHPQWFLCVIVRKAEGLDAGTETASNLHQKLYYHRLGTDQQEDVLCYEAPDEPKWMFGAEVTDDGKVRCPIRMLAELEVLLFEFD
jgi:hypothetical protein